MRPGTAPGRGWTVLSVALASAALGVLFGVLNHFEPAGSAAFWFNLVTPLAFSVPGAVIVGYRPANPIGWILSTMGLAAGVSLFLNGLYATKRGERLRSLAIRRVSHMRSQSQAVVGVQLVSVA